MWLLAETKLWKYAKIFKGGRELSFEYFIIFCKFLLIQLKTASGSSSLNSTDVINCVLGLQKLTDDPQSHFYQLNVTVQSTILHIISENLPVLLKNIIKIFSEL